MLSLKNVKQNFLRNGLCLINIPLQGGVTATAEFNRFNGFSLVRAVGHED